MIIVAIKWHFISKWWTRLFHFRVRGSSDSFTRGLFFCHIFDIKNHWWVFSFAISNNYFAIFSHRALINHHKCTCILSAILLNVLVNVGSWKFGL
jgi:hypothetical protein